MLFKKEKLLKLEREKQQQRQKALEKKGVAFYYSPQERIKFSQQLNKKSPFRKVMGLMVFLLLTLSISVFFFRQTIFKTISQSNALEVSWNYAPISKITNQTHASNTMGSLKIFLHPPPSFRSPPSLPPALTVALQLGDAQGRVFYETMRYFPKSVTLSTAAKQKAIINLALPQQEFYKAMWIVLKLSASENSRFVPLVKQLPIHHSSF